MGDLADLIMSGVAHKWHCPKCNMTWINETAERAGLEYGKALGTGGEHHDLIIHRSLPDGDPCPYVNYEGVHEQEVSVPKP